MALGFASAPAAADDGKRTLKYTSEGRNTYDVLANVTVTRDGNEGYRITGGLWGHCHYDDGASQYMALEYGASSESWKRIEVPCSEHSFAPISGGGAVPWDGDRRVWLRVGAYGGGIPGWGGYGWSDKISVAV